MDILESVPASGRKMTYEEFLARCDERNAVEWVDGEIIYMTVSLTHNKLNLWLINIITIYLEHYLNGELFADSVQMKTGPDLPGRAPDVCVLLNENLGRLRENFIDGPADFVIEIISPESLGRDRGDKFVEYESGGVREYWIIDPIRKQADFYLRGDDGLFHPTTPNAAGIYRSSILDGLWVDVEWLWRTPRPTVAEVQTAWKLN
jgi:Uma2 family endonuclease